MKKIGILLSGLVMTFGAVAQTDSTRTDTTKPATADTIKVGGMIIIRKGDPNQGDNNGQINVHIGNRRSKRRSSINWWTVDLGFANFTDNTNYNSAEAQAFAPGLNEDNLELRTGKSVNVNIWIFMQKLKLIQDDVSL